MLNALTYAFAKDILHRDLKLQNVLFCPEGVVKVADFGISKLRSFIAPACTVAGFRSEPYAPPEQDFGSFSETRDVYSFAVLTLACLHQCPITTYEDVYRCLDDFDGPPEIEDILKAALSRNPEDRPSNIIKLKNLIDIVQSKREAEFSKKLKTRRIKVKITRSVEEKLRQSLDQVGIDVRKFVIDDLNEICGIGRYKNDKQINRKISNNDGNQLYIRLSLYAAQYLYAAVIDDDTKGFLVLINVFPFQPSYLDFQRESNWRPEISFSNQIGSHVTGDDVDNIKWLINGLAEQEQMLSEKEVSARSEKLFKTWMAILQAKSEIETRRETPIPYDAVNKSGSRIILHTDYPLDDDIVGQPRLIELSENQVVSGEIESIGDSHLVLWVESEFYGRIPHEGDLLFDTRAGRISIHRQRQALDAIRFRRASRNDLGDLLMDPQKAIPPSDQNVIEFIQDDLDKSKQDAVKKALGADSFLVVEGPPGTGKTLFITELVVQTLLHSPKSRILLTSQTHVALDNALERIHKLKPDLKLVRIGRRHDERISPDVEDLLLENRIDKWIESVKESSEHFLENFATEIGVDRKDLNLGMAAERLRASLEKVNALEKRKDVIDEELCILRESEKKRSAADASETFHELKESIREASDMVMQLESELKRARSGVKQARSIMAEIPEIGNELSRASIDELRDWEDAFLRQNEQTRKMHRLVKLAEEWYLRFGRSRDFFAALIADSEVIAGTCLGFAGVRGIQNLDFDLCIVDEASKATVTELLVPLSRSKKWVLVGDRRQLPPFVDDALDDKMILETYNLSQDDLSATLLEILIQNLPVGCVTSLVHQHRMIRPIGNLISNCFYDGRLQSVDDGDPFGLRPALLKPTTWFSTSGLDHRGESRDRQSYKNIAEAGVIRNLLKRIDFVAKAKGTKYSVAVLTGYASQKIELLRAIDLEYQTTTNIDIECNTVDAFQGREADIAIYSITRSNDRGDLGFLRERRRINVALSRAKIALAIIGDAAFIRSAQGINPWNKVLDYIESHPLDCALEEVTDES
ncbi:AAA domain-containing protein [Desulfosarcina cetonica]|uniref:AAA domain-containing protein n=1 Tax=Desulfosarcina cetonica TaxID=90730 RepID=UPI00248CAC82|nr:AAA domain-containing protein [Desulfosarcina cetonica]